jgi:hypothetical protein
VTENEINEPTLAQKHPSFKILASLDPVVENVPFIVKLEEDRLLLGDRIIFEEGAEFVWDERFRTLARTVDEATPSKRFWINQSSRQIAVQAVVSRGNQLQPRHTMMAIGVVESHVKIMKKI